MQYKSQIVVLGAKASKGSYEGNPYDSTTVFYQGDLQEGENYCGQVGAFMKWGLSDNILKIKDLQFPLLAEVTVQQVSNGKTMVSIIKDLVPLPSPADQKPNQTQKSA